MIVVILDFLVPATVLGMIGPVVAKMAVEQAAKAGSAIGDIYFSGAVGSIVGTFLAGLWHWSSRCVSLTVTIVAAALALLAAVMLGDVASLLIGVTAAICLGVGSIPGLASSLPNVVTFKSLSVNVVAFIGQVFAFVVGVRGIVKLAQVARQTGIETSPLEIVGDAAGEKVSLTDLAVLSFIASFAFMALEMVAGRLVTRHLGSSIYGWTSVIGVLLGGLSLGNFLGGKLADVIKKETHASWLFLVASILTLSVLYLDNPPTWLFDWLDLPVKSVLSNAITLTKLKLPGSVEIAMKWPTRVFLVTTIVFFLPSLAMGTFSPIVAKLAVERMRRNKKTGTAIGQVYAWGMVGSILGTFLTGFVFIDILGTKGVLLLLATALAFAATALGSIWHAVWAGLPLGLCAIAFIPLPLFQRQAHRLLVREDFYDPNTTEDAIAWIDESDYYFIKVTNEPDSEGQKRTLVLDNLIHGYFILEHPERLDYDYEHIYGLVAYRVAAAKAKAKNTSHASQAPLSTLFLGGGAYTFQRYMQFKYPLTEVDVAEIDPAVTRANHMALGLQTNTPIRTTWGDARQFVERNQGKKQYDIVFGDAFNDFSVPWHLTTREFNEKMANLMSPDGVYMINIIDAYESDEMIKEKADKKIADDNITNEAMKVRIRASERERGREYGGFLGAWVKTAKLTFPHVYIFGTDDAPGSGLRETFVVVASKKPLALDDLGARDDDPQFFQKDKLFEPRPFPSSDEAAIDLRSRGIILTDDYAPVENLLAPDRQDARRRLSPLIMTESTPKKGTARGFMSASRSSSFGFSCVAWITRDIGSNAPNLANSALSQPAAYSWRLTDLDGQPVEFGDYKGKTVFLNIWATWCPPCVAELPSIGRLAANPKLKNVAFLCVALAEPADAVKGFLKGKNLPMTFLTAEDTPAVFSTQGIPATFLIASDGRVAASQIGGADWDNPEVVALLVSLGKSESADTK